MCAVGTEHEFSNSKCCEPLHYPSSIAHALAAPALVEQRQADLSVDQGAIYSSTSASHVMGFKVYRPMLSSSLDFILFSYHFYYTYMYLCMHGP